MSIASEISKLLQVPHRLQNVAGAYVTSLMQEAERRTLQAAAAICGKDSSQFSRLLSGHEELARINLNRLATRRLKKILRGRGVLVKGAPWTVGLLIDATLHERSSLHTDNVQRFNHGQGFVIGHQWTNIVLLIGEEVVPLPPIPFLTKKKCRELGQRYKTEHERVVEYLSALNWAEVLPGVSPAEIVVLMDSGYDNKKLENFILSKGWDFCVSLKKSRAVKTDTQGWQSVESLFQRTRRIGLWQTIRHQASGGRRKRREFRVRTLIATLKGVIARKVAIISAEKPNGERLFLACSRANLNARAISGAYRLRWRIEIFHREVKSYLGFEDAGLEHFTAMRAHCSWVYCAYLLLLELAEGEKSTLARRRRLACRRRTEEIGKILELNGRFDARAALQRHCYQAKARAMAS